MCVCNELLINRSSEVEPLILMACTTRTSQYQGQCYEGKVKLSLYRPWRPLGLREVEAPTFSDIRHTDGCKIKVKLSLYRPWRPLGLREVEAPTFSDIRLTDGGKVVSPTRQPLFTPRKILGTHFC
jgi:hypothetical protein